MEFIIEDYFSDLNLVQDTSMGSDSSVVFQDGLIPYTIGVVFRDKDGFYSGRDNGCNDIFITGLKNNNPQVIQSVDLSIYEALTVQMTTLGLDEIKDIIIDEFPDIQFDYVPPRAGDVFTTKANIEPLKELGWTAEVDIRDGIRDCFVRLKNELR